MAYIEVRKNGKLVKKAPVDTEKARRGCSIKVGSLGKVQLALGESKTLGNYEIRIVEDVTMDDTVDATQPADAGQPEGKRHYAAISDATTPQESIPPGEVPHIEGYQITTKLGEGGMGTVWRAVQLGTKREVALKLLGGRAFGSDKALMRFEREVELAARLEHPGIARVYDSGLHHNVHYYAMELIDGVHLDEYIETNDLSPRQILELIKTITEAIQHAHQRGVIHRDLKPSNIMVTEDGKPCILDFGLAKTSSEDDDAVTISAPGDVAGTPAYMSPEQAAGHIDQIDTRTDVYSLGVILYRLLIRQYPHEMSGTKYEVLRRIAEEEVKRPRDVSKKIDRELEALLLKALAHESSDRYTSAGDLAADINNYLTGEPLTAKAPTTTYFLRKRLRKYRLPVAITAAVLATLIGMAVYAYVNVTWERDRALTAEEDASQQRDVARKEATRADAEARKTKQEAEHNRRALYLTQVSLAAREYEQCNDSSAKRLLDACPEDLRRWEWSYLNNNLASAFAGLDHENVTWASFSPDGSSLATVSEDKTMCLWDANTGRRFWSSAIETRTPAAFTPDSQAIVLSNADGKLEEWDVKDGKIKSTVMNVRRESGASLAISPDGNLIALAGQEIVYLFGKNTGKLLLSVKWPGSLSDSIAFSKDSAKISAISVDTNIWAQWDARTGAGVQTGKLHQSNERLLAVSPGLMQVAVMVMPRTGGLAIPTTVVREITSGRRLCEIPDYEPAAVGRCSFSTEGKQLIVAGQWAIKGYDVGSGKRLFRIRNSELKIRMGADLSKTILAVELKTQRILSSPYCSSTGLIIDGKAYLVRTGRGAEHSDIKAMDAPLVMVQFTPEDRTLATFGMVGQTAPKIKFWNMGPPHDTWTVNAGTPQAPNLPVAFTPDGQSMIAMSAAYGGLAKLDVKSGRIVGGYKMDSRYSGFIQDWMVSRRAVSYAPGGKELVWGRTGQCYVWDAASGKKLRTLRSDAKAAFVCSNGAFAVLVQNLSYGVDKPGRATVMNLTTGETICTLSEQVRLPLAMSRDGRYVLASMTGWSMGVINAQTGKVQCKLSGLQIPPENRGGMESLVSPVALNAFSPDGERIATGGADGRIYLWDTQSGMRILSLNLGRMIATRLVFSPGGKYIAAGLGDGRVRLWATHTNIAAAGQAVSGKITAVHDGVASISIGRAKGIQEKMVLKIFRDGKFVSHLRIDLVEQDSAAGVILDKKLDVLQGDIVARHALEDDIKTDHPVKDVPIGKSQPQSYSGDFRRVVLFKFKDDAPPSDVETVEGKILDMPSEIPTMKTMEWGKNVSVENLADGFTHCLLMTFTNADGLKVYAAPHPAHQTVIKSLGPLTEKLLVFDYVASGGVPPMAPIATAGRLRHIVMFQFKKGTTDQQIKAIENKFRSMSAKIPEIKALEWGTTVGNRANADLTHCFLVTFDNTAGRKVYLPHLAHKEFVKLAGPSVEKVLIIDYIATMAAKSTGDSTVTGVVYAKGDLEAMLKATPTDIAAATEKAFAKLNIPKTSVKASDLDVEILGRMSTGKRVCVRGKVKGGNYTVVSIRVGTLGDEGLSRVILKNILRVKIDRIVPSDHPLDEIRTYGPIWDGAIDPSYELKAVID